MGLQAKSQEGNLSRCLRARSRIRVVLMGRPGARTYTPVSQVTDRTKAGDSTRAASGPQGILLRGKCWK